MNSKNWELTIHGIKFHVIDYEQSLTPMFVANELNEADRLPLDFDPQKIIDIGANVGIWAFYAALTYPHAEILAVEPFALNVYNLEAGIRINEIDNVIVLPLAVDNKVKNLVFGFDHTNSGSASKFHQAKPGFVEFKADAISLEDLILQHGPADLVKVDIEGGEFELFDNFNHWDKIDSLMIEVHPWLITEDKSKHQEMVDNLKQKILDGMKDKVVIMTSSDRILKC